MLLPRSTARSVNPCGLAGLHLIKVEKVNEAAPAASRGASEIRNQITRTHRPGGDEADAGDDASAANDLLLRPPHVSWMSIPRTFQPRHGGEGVAQETSSPRPSS
jgi:hypothetical protein